jgi:hypothetical protein
MVAVIKNLQRPCKPELDSDAGGCYAFFDTERAVSSFSYWVKFEGVLAVFLFGLYIVSMSDVLSTSFAAKTGGCIYRLPENKSLLGHPTALFSENRPSNQ